MPKFIDKSGMRYGRLTVVRRHGTTGNKKVLWECLCSCGKTAYVESGSLATGNTQSCGCLFKDQVTKHGGSGKRSYNTWRSVLRRCNDPTDKDYPRYGALGVSVDPHWLKYENFVADMGEPEEGRTLDRIDPYGNYTKSNCRWADATTQARNLREFNGPRGVRLRGKKWYAEITVARKKFYSKPCETKEQAVIERQKLKEKHWGNLDVT